MSHPVCFSTDFGPGNGADDTADGDIWDDASGSPDHRSILHRKWAYSQELLQKVYHDFDLHDN